MTGVSVISGFAGRIGLEDGGPETEEFGDGEVIGISVTGNRGLMKGVAAEII